jgi:TP901 family phage tail tape measure protein
MAAGRFSTEHTFRAIDRLTRPVQKMMGTTEKFTRTVRREFAQAQRSVERFNRTVSTRLGQGLKRGAQIGVTGLAVGLGIATREFVSFDDSIIAAGARFKVFKNGAEAGKKELEKLRAAARHAGATTEFTATQAASALDFLARSGFKSTDAMNSLKTMIDLSTASGTEFARAADISSDLISAFGLAAEDPAQKLINLTRLNDVLTETVNSANVDLENLFETMKGAAPIGAKFGADLEQVAAFAGVLGNSGIKGTEALTALKNIFLRMAAQPKPVRDALEALGITVDDGTGNLKKMSVVLREVGEALKGRGTIEVGKRLDQLFGKRAIAGAANLADNIPMLNEFEARLRKAGGTAERTAEQIRKSLGNQLKTLGSAALELGFKILDAFAGKGQEGIKRLTEAIRNFDPKPMIEGLKNIFGLIFDIWSIVKPFVPMLLTFVVAWKLYTGALFLVAQAHFMLSGVMTAFTKHPILLMIAALIGIIIVLKTQWKSLGPVMKVVLIAVGSLVAGILTVIGAFKAWAAIQVIVNMLLAANPVGLLLTAIGLLTVGLMFLIDNWYAVVKFLKKTWKSVINFFEENELGVSMHILTANVLKPFTLIVDAVKFLISKIPVLASTIKKAFMGIPDVVEKIAGFFGGKIDVEERRRGEGRGEQPTVVTQSERISRSITEKRHMQEILLKNKSESELELPGGKVVFPGSSILLEASG